MSLRRCDVYFGTEENAEAGETAIVAESKGFRYYAFHDAPEYVVWPIPTNPCSLGLFVSDLSDEKEEVHLTIFIEISGPVQMKPGMIKTRLMYRFWWLWFAFVWLRVPYMEYENADRCWTLTDD